MYEVSKHIQEDDYMTCCTKCESVFKNFYNNSSLLGLRYITDAKSSRTERLVWALGLTFSLAACVILVLPVWERWRNSTVIVQQSIADIPFPAITICPAMKINTEKDRLFFKTNEDLQITADMNTTWRHLSLVCPNFISGPERYFQMENNDAIKTIEKYALEVLHIMTKINMYPKLVPPHFFRPIITEEGLCYTFNSMPGNYIFKHSTFHGQRKYLFIEVAHSIQRVVQWNPQDGYDKDANESAYPLRITGTNQETSFRITISNLSQDNENICTPENHAFSITVHNPADVARPSQSGWHVQEGLVVHVLLTPKVVWTEDKVRHSYTPQERQCFYPQERLLSFFNHYTQTNCELECLANYTLHLCGCVGFYMPRLMTTPVCNAHNRKCMDIAEWEMYKFESNQQSGSEQTISQYINKKSKGLSCNCLQSCNYIQYQSHLNINPTPRKNKYYGARPPTILVFFEKSHFFPIKRVELSGIIDFIANCGGLLGLCLGFSMLTFVEMFYWLLLQPYLNRRRRKKNSIAIERNLSMLSSTKTDIVSLSELY